VSEFNRRTNEIFLERAKIFLNQTMLMSEASLQLDALRHEVCTGVYEQMLGE
jgi:hypothetical protein